MSDLLPEERWPEERLLLEAAQPSAWGRKFGHRLAVVGECWEYTGYRSTNGYGHTTNSEHNRKWAREKRRAAKPEWRDA